MKINGLANSHMHHLTKKKRKKKRKKKLTVYIHSRPLLHNIPPEMKTNGIGRASKRRNSQQTDSLRSSRSRGQRKSNNNNTIYREKVGSLSPEKGK